MPTKRTVTNNKRISLVFGVFDIIVTLATLVIASLITNNYTNETVVYDQEFHFIALFIVLTWIILLKTTYLARIPRTSALPIILGDFVKLTIIGGGILLLLDFIIKFDNFPAIALSFFIVINFFSLFIVRIVTFKVFRRFRANGHNIRNIVLIADEGSVPLIDKILNQKEWGFRILHIVTDSKKIIDKYREYVKIYPKSANIKSIIRFDIVDELLCCDMLGSEKRTYEIIDFCHDLGVTVRLSCNKTYYNKTYKTRIQYFDRLPFLTIENNPINRLSHTVKSIIEISVAFGILILLSPILIVISVLIAVSKKGPIFYKQERVGIRGRKFYMYKFCTGLGNDLRIDVKGTTGVEKSNRGICCIIYRFLRKTNLDELPQLLNVIKGEMAIIGPRPPLPFEVEEYQEWQLNRLSVKPGLTCTWQIIPNRNEIVLEKRIKMDIQYIENWSLKSDVDLFFKTFKVIFARGA